MASLMDEGWGDGVIDTQSMQIRCLNYNARTAFSQFFHAKTTFQKRSIWMINQNYAKRAFTQKSVPTWMAPNSCPLVIKSLRTDSYTRCEGARALERYLHDFQA